MIDLIDFVPPGTRVMPTEDFIIASKSGMRKVKFRRFIHDEDLPVFFFELGLFAGEGRHRFTQSTTERIEFINSNLDNVKLFHKFMKIVGISDLAKARIQLKSGLDYESALEYWCKALSIPKANFYTPLVFPKKTNNLRVCKYGALELRINSALTFKLISFWTQAFLVSKISGPEEI